ncbi:MAG: hypothetical protein J1E06_01855 [Acutalibacter sp.]|nr:hypothetical protein [Acutalibacter sp.]
MLLTALKILEAVPIAPAHIFPAQNAAGCVKKSGNTKVFLQFFALPAAFFARKAAHCVYWYSF